MHNNLKFTNNKILIDNKILISASKPLADKLEKRFKTNISEIGITIKSETIDIANI